MSLRSVYRSVARAVAIPLLRYGPARLLVRSDRFLRALVDAWGNPEWSADVAYLRAIVTHCSTARVVLESGSGVSTLIAAAAVPRGCTVIAIEHLDEWADRVESKRPRASILRRPIVNCGNYDWYEVRPSDLPTGIEVVICDGPPGVTRGGRYGLLPQARGAFAPGALILLDDAQRPGEADVIARWEKEGVVLESIDGGTALLRVDA